MQRCEAGIAQILKESGSTSIDLKWIWENYWYFIVSSTVPHDSRMGCIFLLRYVLIYVNSVFSRLTGCRLLSEIPASYESVWYITIYHNLTDIIKISNIHSFVRIQNNTYCFGSTSRMSCFRLLLRKSLAAFISSL